MEVFNMHTKCHEDITNQQLSEPFREALKNLNQKDAQILFEKCYDNKDCPIAMNLLGLCYTYGIHVKPNEVAEAECFKKSADRNNAYGLGNLAECYYVGCGVPLDLDKSFELYVKSAHLGCASSLEELAGDYYDEQIKNLFITDSEMEAAKLKLAELEEENKKMKS
jgi:TPR repeat protein